MLLLLLAACPDPGTKETDAVDTADTDTAAPDTDTDTDTGPELLDCDTGGECCHDPLPWLLLCFDSSALAPDEVLVGSFTTWRTGSVTFTTTAGDEVPGYVNGDAEALAAVPDLSASGELSVTQLGDCGGKGNIYAVVHVAGPAGDTLLLTGSMAITDFHGFTVTDDKDVTSCGPREGSCSEFVHERPIVATHGADTQILWQGDERPLDTDYLMRVNYSRSGSGELLCDDVTPEDTNYWIVGPG